MSADVELRPTAVSSSRNLLFSIKHNLFHTCHPKGHYLKRKKLGGKIAKLGENGTILKNCVKPAKQKPNLQLVFNI